MAAGEGGTDRIEIRGLRAFGRHGVLASEQTRGQEFVVDVWLDVDLATAAATDDLAETVDYGTLADDLAEAVAATRFDLIEALAGHLAERCLAEARVEGVRVRVAKPDAPVRVALDEVAVELERSSRR
ncbi:MAG: dihydroneopterin aldolase [Actinomycetota bacterium]